MKIRIGTDLNFLITTKGLDGNTNIQSVCAYIVNRDLLDKVKKQIEKKTRFISRFPIEPMIDSYVSTEYNIHGTGYPSYRAYPYKKLSTPYAGFGVEPQFNFIYPEAPEYRFTRYCAQVKASKIRNKVQVFFPADQQLYVGKYDIILIVKVYDEGYMNNVKTITIDYSNAFELVKTTAEQDLTQTDEYITLAEDRPEDIPVENEQLDIHVSSGSHDGNSTLQLNLNDGQYVNINTSNATGWWEE